MSKKPKFSHKDRNPHDDLKDAPQEPAPIKIDNDAVKKEAAQRAKKQPLLQRIIKAIKGENKTFRELIINSEPLEKRVALLVDGILDKFEVERVGEQRMVGSIFKGKIQNLENGLKAAFVDIGQPKNAFLHYWDILPGANDSSIEIVRENQSASQKQKKLTIAEIPGAYPIGTEIVVQITKAQIGTKGPRTTTNIALPGRYLVYMPNCGQCGISRKIEDKKERQRLKKILNEIQLPEDVGVIIRTAGEGKKTRYFIRDLYMLKNQWDEIQAKLERAKGPTMLYQEPDLIERTIRDFLTEDIDRVIVDNKEDYEKILKYVDTISPRSKSKIHFYEDNIPVFERFNIQRQIEQTFRRRVPLLSGGEIVIEETEALIAIDVNTGGHKGGDADKEGKNFILNCNLEAAREAARQIRLRNMGGLIILDFIDMKNARDRKAVLNCMKDNMSDDKAKTHILPISELGIMQMTRQRHQESNSRGIYTCCPYCGGRGSVKSARTMSVEIQRQLMSVVRHLRAKGMEGTVRLKTLLHPTVLERLRIEDEQILVEMEEFYNVELSFLADPSYHMENFKIVDPDTEKEIK